MSQPLLSQRASSPASALLIAVFIIATCGLVYELIAGTIASYLLGDSVTQFSTVIGVYLFSMGVGSFVSRYVQRHLVPIFVQVELLIGFVGGGSAAILFLAFEHLSAFRVLLYSLVGLTGILVGLEIPLLMRILKHHFEFRDLVSRVFSVDYVGALIASLLFPLVLVPHLGLIRSAFLFGMLNVLVALWTLVLLKRDIPWFAALRTTGILLLVALLGGFIYADRLMSMAEAATFPDRVIYATSSPYQRIVLTKREEDLRLYLNNNLQFSARDEYRYHEALVHVGLAGLKQPRHVLVLGGGDGLAVREILKYPTIDTITLVDLDQALTRLFSHQALLTRLNHQALTHPKVRVIHEDAFVWLRNHTQPRYDFVVMDFPDPGSFSLGKLYSDTFFRTVKAVLAPHGRLVLQSTSPYHAPRSFWCVVATLEAVGLTTTPYHAYVPSFGEWGFVLAGREPFVPASGYPAGLRYVSPQMVAQMQVFAPDMTASASPVNKLNNQVLVHLFETEWSRYVDPH